MHHDNTKYDGFRLTYMGYDFLAIRALTAKGHIVGLGSQIGVGKESDIYEVRVMHGLGGWIGNRGGVGQDVYVAKQ